MSTVYTTPREAIRNMGRVFFALILREAATRYGKIKIGYVWAFLEPMLFIAALAIIFSYGRALQSGDMPQILFYTTGILPFFLFRDIVTRTMTAIQGNYQLLTFPQVQVFDLIIARALLEIATFFIVFTVLVGTIALLNIEPVHIDDPLRMLEAITLISLLGLGFGAAMASLVPLFPTLQFLINSVLLRPLFFVSGIFFTADIIPNSIRHYVLYNPLLQLGELFRSAFFTGFESEYVEMPYLVGFTLVTLFLGLLLQRALKRHAMRVPI